MNVAFVTIIAKSPSDEQKLKIKLAKLQARV